MTEILTVNECEKFAFDSSNSYHYIGSGCPSHQFNIIDCLKCDVTWTQPIVLQCKGWPYLQLVFSLSRTQSLYVNISTTAQLTWWITSSDSVNYNVGCVFARFSVNTVATKTNWFNLGLWQIFVHQPHLSTSTKLPSEQLALATPAFPSERHNSTRLNTLTTTSRQITFLYLFHARHSITKRDCLKVAPLPRALLKPTSLAFKQTAFQQ